MTERGRSALFTRRIVEERALAHRPFVLVDVGARGGFAAHWSVFGDQIQYIGFEPDAEECARINRATTHPNLKVYPFALHRSTGTHPFYVTRFPNSSGMYPIDMTIAKRFPIWEPLTVERVTELHTVDFDSFASEHGVARVDFIKLDTEGSELDVLEGAQRAIDSSVLGVSSEVLFTPWHSGQRVFSDLDAFLRHHGLALYDLSLLKFARTALPSIATATKPTTAVADYGQTVVGEALYLRDPVRDIESGRTARWDETAVLKMACVYEIFELPDCAIELLRSAHGHGLLRYSAAEVDAFCDLIVEGFAGVTYVEYMARFATVRRRGYRSRREHLARKWAVVAHYGRRLLVERHPPSWYVEKLKARLPGRARA